MIKKTVSKQKFSRHATMIALALAIVLLVGISAYALILPKKDGSETTTTKTTNSPSSTTKPPNTVDYNPPVSSDSEVSDQTKKDDSTTNQSNSAPIAITITRVANVGNSVVIGTTVEGTRSGTCTLTATQAGQSPIVRSNSVEAQATSSACPNFTIAHSEFPAGGSWKFTVTLNSNGSSATNTWPEQLTVNK